MEANRITVLTVWSKHTNINIIEQKKLSTLDIKALNRTYLDFFFIYSEQQDDATIRNTCIGGKNVR